MTKASAGFQPPSGIAAKSRNASTTAGSIIRDRLRPAPKRRPAAKAASMRIGLASAHVKGDEDDGGADGHKGQRRRQRPWRHSGETANAVPTCTPAAEPRTDADQQTGKEDYRRGGIDADFRQRRAAQHCRERPGDKPCEEGEPPADVAGAASEQTANNPRDAGDATDGPHQQDGGKPDQDAAGKRDDYGIHGFPFRLRTSRYRRY